MSGGTIEQVEKNMVGSLENIQNNLAGTMLNVENNILSAINNLNLSSTSRFPDGIFGWKFYRPGFVETVAQINMLIPDPFIGSDVLLYSKTGIHFNPSNPDDDFFDPGIIQKYLGMKDNVAYWVGTGFTTSSGKDGMPISYEHNPTGQILYGSIQYLNFNTNKYNYYGLTTPSQFYTINTIDDAESSIANGDAVPWLVPAMNNTQVLLKSMGLDLIGDPFAFTYEPITSLTELNAAYLHFLESE